MQQQDVFRNPDLSTRPFSLTVARSFKISLHTLFRARLTDWEMWFAAPGSLLSEGKVNTPFFFETEFRSEAHALVQRHPHYGRFLKIITDRLVQLTWVTGAGGTKGAETVVTVEFIPQGQKTRLKLTHSGFPDEASKNAHLEAWPMVLDHLEQIFLKRAG